MDLRSKTLDSSLGSPLKLSSDSSLESSLKPDSDKDWEDDWDAGSLLASLKFFTFFALCTYCIFYPFSFATFLSFPALSAFCIVLVLGSVITVAWSTGWALLVVDILLWFMRVLNDRFMSSFGVLVGFKGELDDEEIGVLFVRVL